MRVTDPVKPEAANAETVLNKEAIEIALASEFWTKQSYKMTENANN